MRYVVRDLKCVGRVAVAVSLAVALSVSGCTSIGPQSDKAARPKQPVTGAIRVSGSGSALPLIELLASDFEKINPRVRVVFLTGAHCEAAYKGTASGDFDVGALSRYPEPGDAKYHLERRIIAKDALAIAVHPSVRVRGLSMAQLRAIYSGEIRNWSQVGGPSLRIVVLDRSEDECAKKAMRQAVFGPGLKVTPDAVRIAYEREMPGTISNTAGSIGYLSYGWTRIEPTKARILEVNGVAPSCDHVLDGSYPISRQMSALTKKNTPARVRVFLDYLTGPRAAGIMRESGYAPYWRSSAEQ